VRSYEGAGHGFAVRAEKELEKTCGEEAVEQALGWFGRWEAKGDRVEVL
jgi:tRNA(Met) C34 N-acetyltransferase TmcA